MRSSVLSAPTSVELTRAALERLERSNARLRAFSHVAAEEALADAARADAELAAGRTRGPLHGVPVGVKDLVAVRGMPLEAGSATLRGNLASEDAPVVERLREAGAIVLGKTTVDEFALTTVGPARNPHDERRSAGGSSGGSAAAVAAGICRVAIGTDTGGSVRIPAACCEVVGLKPTYGWIPTTGVIALAPSLDTVGVIGASVADAAALLQVLAGRDSRDLSGSREPVDSYRPEPRRLDSLRLAVPDDRYLDGAEPAVLAACRDALERLQAGGVDLVEVELPPLAQVREIHWTVLAFEAAAYHRARFPDEIERYGEPLRRAIAAGTRMPEHEYETAKQARARLRAQMSAALDGVDAVALPTLPIGPPMVGQTEVELDGAREDVVAAMVRLTSTFNHTGHPALSLPAGRDEHGLPFGLQLVGGHFGEAPLLAVAAALEPVLGA